MQVLSEKVLVLNKNFFVLCAINVKAALRLVFSEKAVIMDDQFMSYTAEDWREYANPEGKQVIRTPSKSFVVPEVIRLTDFDQIISRPTSLTRQNIFIRDDYVCQYCGSTEKLTIDHVIPRSRALEFGMKSHEINSWENMTTCCEKCNNKKDNKTPKEANMKLTSKPIRPTYTVIGYEAKQVKDLWKLYLGKEAK